MAYKTQNTPNLPQPQFALGSVESMSPVWAQLLYKGVGKRDKLKEGAKALEKDPSLLFKGLLGKSLLDKHINPFFREMLPDSLELDVLKQQMKFSPTNRFNMTLGKRGDTTNLGFDWRF
jgi:hypothetical protein